MTAPAPPPVESQVLHFKQLLKLKTRHDVSKNIYKKPTNLLAISNLHGLTFVGELNALKVIPSSELYNDLENLNTKILYKYHHRNVVLPSSPTHIDINAEQKLLAVIFIHNNVPILRIYVIDSFFDQDIVHFPEIRLSSTATTYVSDLSWNPGIPNILACCISDGSLSIYTFNASDNYDVKSLPIESASVCVSWSPKGKQIVVGNYLGYLTQYLPELKAVKNVPPPTGLFPKACTLYSVKWISNFQYIGVYKMQENGSTDDEDIKSCVVVINTPKNGPVQYINYEDICFSSGTDRPIQFYFNHIPSWNLIFVSSSNSLEVAVLSLSGDNLTWVLWTLEPEEMRITLPFPPSGEAFPVGVAIDFSLPLLLPIDDKTVQFPALVLMTCEGILCIYWINYLNFAVPNVCSPVNWPTSLQHFSSEPIVEEEYSPKAVSPDPPEPGSFASEDLSGVAYNVTQSYPQTQVDTAPTNAPEQPQIPNIPLLSDLSSAFNFETSLAKGMTQKSTNVESILSSISFNQETQNQSVLPSKVEQETSIPSLGEVTDAMKKAEHQKSRLEAVKKFKERASVFENDIQEIKNMVNNIDMSPDEPRLQMLEKFSKLEDTFGRLKVTNKTLRSDVDVLRTSVIEVFAYIQDVKSKLFLFTNPGFHSLTGAQDIDPISANNLSTIRSTINYVRTQVENAKQQLDDVWFKFSQSSVGPTTKVPILENIYETMVKQQKILSYLKLQIGKLEKSFCVIVQRLCRENRHLSLQNDLPWSMNKLLNENMSLDDLTKKALNLNSLPDDQLQPKQLALKYSREHAKHFHLSYGKQLKLQESHSVTGITHIKSSRIQRLKQKSLVTLSKSTNESDVKDEKVVQKRAEPLQITMISPISSEDEKTEMISVFSSTPLKSAGMQKFAMEGTLPIEPSIIRPTSTVPSKLVFPISTNSSTSKLNISKPEEVKTLQSEEAPTQESVTITLAQHPLSTALATSTTTQASRLMSETTTTSFSGTSLFSGKTFASTTSTFPTLTGLLTVTTSSGITPTPSVTTNVPRFPSIGATISPQPAIASTASTQAPFFSNLSGSSIFSSVANNAISTSPSSSIATTVLDTKFSFAPPKSESSGTTAAPPVFAMPTMTSIFSGKPIQTTDTTSTGPVKSSLPMFSAPPNAAVAPSLSGQSLFKAISSSSSALPSFGNVNRAATISTETSVSATSTLQSAVASTVTPCPSLFGKDASTPSKPSATSSPSIFANVSTPSKPSATSSPSIFASVSTLSKPSATSSPSIFGNASTHSKPSASTNSVINTIDFGAMLSGSPSSVNAPPVDSSATTTAAASTSGQPTSAFSTFSFANKPYTTSEVLITEVHDEETDVKTKYSDISPISTPPPSNLTSSAADIKANTSSSVAPPSETPAFSSTATTPDTVGTIVNTASSEASPAVPSTSVSTSTSGTGTLDNATSFFGGLNLKPTPVAVETSQNPPIFGKAPSVSSVPPMFGGSGANIFSQATNTTTATSVAESKPLFGSGVGTPLFGPSTAVPADTKNLFSSTPSSDNVQSNAGSPFSGGGSMFGSGSLFGSTSTTQANTFGSTTGGSVFGSNFSASYQNTSSGFGAPPSFSNVSQQQQQQQPQPSNESGFGSPTTFSSVFNKNSAAFGAFGGAPTFGGSPLGNSPTSVFGQSSANMGAFGTTTAQQPTAFDAMANENTMTFGNLAQQQQQPSGFGSPPSFGNTNPNPAFGSNANFGSSSFSSWR